MTTQWQTIETAPKDGTRILGWNYLWMAPNTIGFYGTDWMSHYELGAFTYPPTHWMEMPTVPDELHTDVWRELKTIKEAKRSA